MFEEIAYKCTSIGILKIVYSTYYVQKIRKTQRLGTHLRYSTVHTNIYLHAVIDK